MINLMKSVLHGSELDLLMKENKLRADCLSSENRQILYKLIQRLSASKLSLFDIQIAQKDFIGMALEAEQRGETLHDVIGDDMNTFCKELAENGHQRTWGEFLILSLPSILLAFTAIYGINYVIFYSYPAIMKITLSDILFYFIYCFLGVVMGNYFIRKTIFQTSIQKRMSYMIIPAAFVLLIVVKSLFLSDRIILMETIGWLPLAIGLFLLIITCLLRNMFLRQQAKNYHWNEDI